MKKKQTVNGATGIDVLVHFTAHLTNSPNELEQERRYYLGIWEYYEEASVCVLQA